MINRFFGCDHSFEVYTYFLIIVTAYVSRGLNTYFGTEWTTHVVRRLEIVLLDDGMARIQHIGFVITNS